MKTVKSKRPSISKSRYLFGRQCHKLLWYQFNAAETIPEADPQTQALFDQGHEVGQLAKKLFPEGIELSGNGADFEQALAVSEGALAHRRPLFEPAFKYGNAHARVDILNPVGGSGWEIIEVKSSTSVQDINLGDLALQRYVCEGAGLSIRSCFIIHVNSRYVRKGEIDPRMLFTKVDVSKDIRLNLKDVPINIEAMLRAIGEPVAPEIKIGSHCTNPYDCPLQELCWKFLPEDNPLTLYCMKKDEAFELIHLGHLDLRNIPASTKLTDKQTLQVKALRDHKPHVDRESIKTFLSTLRYPLYYLDFETLGTAIPLFDGARPYEQIPFQFSLHTVKAGGTRPTHQSYLAEGKIDPRPEILNRLRDLLGSKGSIVSYNASFEMDKLDKACQVYEAFGSWYKQIKPRFADLLVPFKSFHYYHPKQHGSASIKAVLPALTGTSYDEMEISNGGMASLEYLRTTFGNATETERQRVRKALEMYCGLDTRGMVQIVEKLYQLAGS